MAQGKGRVPTHPPLLGLRGRMLAMALLPVLIACLAMAGYYSYRGIVEAEDRLRATGLNLARNLAEASARDLLQQEPLYLKRLFDHVRAENDALAIGLSDSRGQWWLVSGQASMLMAPPRLDVAHSARHDDRFHFSHPVHEIAEPTDPGGAHGRVIGQLVTVFSNARINDAKSEIIAATFTVLSLLLLPTSLLAWRLSTRVSLPIEDSIRTVRSLNNGELEVRTLEIASGELRELEKGINRLAERLHAHAVDTETRVRDATSDLLRQKQASDAATSAKSRFLAAASHDLRQPLHTMMLLVGALRERLQESDVETSRLTANIEGSALAMGMLLNALLDLSRLDAGTIVARPECFPIANLLDNLAIQFAPLAQEKGIRLRIHRSDLNLFSDPTLLERILANLLSNAIRYTDAGGVLLGVRRVQKDWARIEIWDTGPGIPPEYQERIFDEFFQLDGREDRSHGKGLGLGLSIVKRLVRLLGSGVELHSRPGKGSRFSVRAIRCERSPGWSNTHSTTDTRLGRRPMIAFIDDDTRILEAMLMLFEEWGVESAMGEEANTVVQDCHNAGRVPDIIISDYRLAEGRTGIEAIAALRAEFGPGIPAILVTGETDATTIQAIEGTGMPVLYKPLKPAKLRALLSHLLGSADASGRPG